MDILPKRNRLTDRQERDLALKLSGGPGASKAQIAQNLNKIRAVTNEKGGPLTNKQIDTLARGMAGGGKSADPKETAKNRAGIRQITGQQKSPAKSDKPAKPSPTKKDVAPKAANDNRKAKALKDGQPSIVRLPSGKTFVHKSALQKSSTPSKSPTKDMASRRQALGQSAKPPPASPARTKGRERSR